ncbi:MAG: hypothetical protein AUK44_05825 [Porphyromonadaceae bacterium CG2_30_38_12]|nr:MAG: hypothetical protein AUK44_05825 [Porphyromonadaceae bacterium CG2_30_38_12]
MKRLIIICEGETEQEFCKDVLYNHFFSRDIVIETPLIKKSMGGIVAWEHIKSQILLHLKEDVTVTLLIDYYGIKNYHNFPKWAESKTIVNKIDRMTFLENAMKEDIDDVVRFRFIPYIQLHAFEGLLFNNIETFKGNIPDNEFTNILELERTINLHANPELINDGLTTAPSKRLESLIKGYNKIVYGAILAEEIGLERLRAKAVRFNEWIAKLESI